MTRRKKPPRPKRRHITDSEGWTHITTSNKTSYLNNAVSSQRKILPAEAPNGQTLNDLQNSYIHYREQWRSSSCHQSTQHLLDNTVSASLRFRESMDRCVVLGLGSLSNGRRSSWWELVFLETVLDCLSPPPLSEVERKKPQDKQFKLYVQDPVFNDMDKAFLKSLGYTVLPDPEAFEWITPSTLLFAPHLEVDLYTRALDKAKPRPAVRKHGSKEKELSL
ncbi:MAG: hypothetical protein Q9170_000180 [Blastenia crenularia]